MAAWKTNGVRSTGDIITAAVWNYEFANSKSAAHQQADELLERYREPMLVGGSGPELVTPIVQAASELFVECERCAQVNLLEPKQAYKGCGACGAPFSLEAVKEAAGVEPVRVQGPEKIDLPPTTAGSSNHTYELTDGVNYWVLGDVGQSELGDTAVVGY